MKLGFVGTRCDHVCDRSRVERRSCRAASHPACAYAIASWLARHRVPSEQARNHVARVFRGLAEAAVKTPERSFKLFADEHATRGGINELVLTHLVEHGVFENRSQGLDTVPRRLTSAEQEP